MEPPDVQRSLTFVIRIRSGPSALRGQVVAVATGETCLFEGLADAMAFIRGQIAGSEISVAAPTARDAGRTRKRR